MISIPQFHKVVSRNTNLNIDPFILTRSELPTVNRESTDYSDRTHISARKDIIGCSQKFLDVLSLAEQVATSKANVLISGETGTGKEVIAKFIHNVSSQKGGNFVAINCSAIPENLLESELFGHSKGAFTGAQLNRAGLFEEAQDGTLFLDEIGDLGLPLQAKILRVLQERTIRRVGENIVRPVNCRFISATNKRLEEEVDQGKFREDLFYRLNVIPLELPPLRERPEDLLLLANFFLKKFSRLYGLPSRRFTADAEALLGDHLWKGNVRELENCVERAVVLNRGSEIDVPHFMTLTAAKRRDAKQSTDTSRGFFVEIEHELPKLDDIILKYIEFSVTKMGGARDKTAREIGIDRKTLYKKLKYKKFEGDQLVI